MSVQCACRTLCFPAPAPVQMPFRLGFADKKYSFFTVKNFTEQKFQVHKNWEIGHFSDPVRTLRPGQGQPLLAYAEPPHPWSPTEGRQEACCQSCQTKSLHRPGRSGPEFPTRGYRLRAIVERFQEQTRQALEGARLHRSSIDKDCLRDTSSLRRIHRVHPSAF